MVPSICVGGFGHCCLTKKCDIKKDAKIKSVHKTDLSPVTLPKQTRKSTIVKK